MRLFILATMVGLVVGCGKSDSGANTTTNALQGTWSVTCAPNDTGSFSTITITFQGANVRGHEQVYSDRACTTRTRNEQSSGTYTLGGDVAGQAGVKEIDFTMTGGDKSFSIVKVEGNRLQGGKSSPGRDGNTAATRHTQLSRLVLTKQP